MTLQSAGLNYALFLCAYRGEPFDQLPVCVISDLELLHFWPFKDLQLGLTAPAKLLA